MQDAMSAEPSAPAAETREQVSRVRGWLDDVVQVELTDGRVVEGHLECFDKPGNIILGDAYEVRGKNGKERARFALGLVLAPASAVIAIRVRAPAAPRPARSVTGQMNKLSLGGEGRAP